MYCDFRHHHFQQLPCLRCHPHSYIRMVQHLIERCLLLHLSRDQCIKALAEQASIRPQITLTVWRELQKENREFFHAYFHSIYPRHLTIRNYIQREARFTRRKHYWSVQLQILMAALVIGGGIANFTDVAATFNGIIRALKEKEAKLKTSEKNSVFPLRSLDLKQQ